MLLLLFPLSLISGLGLYWIIKYKTKTSIFRQSSIFSKSILILMFSNIFYWIGFFFQVAIWKGFIVNDKSYESSDGNMGGDYVSKDIAELYHILAGGISIITILCFIIIFIVGLNTRNKKRENISIVDKKPKTLLMIGLSLLLLVFLLISMIMFVMSSNFAVSYQE